MLENLRNKLCLTLKSLYNESVTSLFLMIAILTHRDFVIAVINVNQKRSTRCKGMLHSNREA